VIGALFRLKDSMKYAVFSNDLYQTQPGSFVREEYSPNQSDAHLYEDFDDAYAQMMMLEQQPRLLQGWEKGVPLPFHILDLTDVYEGPEVLARLFDGPASVMLVTSNYSPACQAAVGEMLGPAPDPASVSRLVFLEGLTNGRQKGLGARVLNQALGWAARQGKTPAIYAQSPSGDHDRLLAWFLRTGWLTHAVDWQNYRLKYILVPKG